MREILKIILYIILTILFFGSTAFGLHYLGCYWKTIASIQMPFINIVGLFIGWKIGELCESL